MSDIFEYKTHFDCLREKLGSKHGVRGVKTKFSEFLRIQPAFLSQVLARKYPLSLEQADLANRFFDHSTEEAEFFLLLVSRDRAGTVSLRNHFEKQIDSMLKKRQLVVERLGRKSEITAEAKGIYYSSWAYGAIHIGCTIPHLRTRKDLAQYLNLPIEYVGKILDFLVENNLLRKELDGYLPTENWLRIDKESPHVIKHHSNWRNRAIQNLEVQTDEDLHYSGVFSMNKKTAHKIKDDFFEFIKLQLKDIENAKEENLFVLGIDFFDLIKNS